MVVGCVLIAAVAIGVVDFDEFVETVFAVGLSRVLVEDLVGGGDRGGRGGGGPLEMAVVGVGVGVIGVDCGVVSSERASTSLGPEGGA